MKRNMVYLIVSLKENIIFYVGKSNESIYNNRHKKHEKPKLIFEKYPYIDKLEVLELECRDANSNDIMESILIATYFTNEFNEDKCSEYYDSYKSNFDKIPTDKWYLKCVLIKDSAVSNGYKYESAKQKAVNEEQFKGLEFKHLRSKKLKRRNS